MEENYCVYKHTSPSYKIYIGITNNIDRRWGRDGKDYKPKNGRNQNLPFWNAIQKYGWGNFKHEVLADNLTKEKAEQYERALIKQYDCRNRNIGYNVAEGGNGGRIYIDHPKSMLGKKQTAHQKASQREWASNHENNCMTNGNVVWGETHEHPRGMLGKHQSEKHKLAMENFRGENNPTSVSIYLVYPNGSIKNYGSISELQRDIGFCFNLVKRLLETGEEYQIKVRNQHTAKNEKYVGIKIFYKDNTEITIGTKDPIAS